MKDKFIMIKDYILQKEEITWIKIEGNKVIIVMNNGNEVVNTTETEKVAREVFQDIWNALK